MFYSYQNKVMAANTVTNPILQTLDLIPGIIHQVDILFEDGCDHEAHVQISHGSTQVWPTNTQGSILGDAMVVSFREFYELMPGATDLTLKIWGDGTIDDVDVILQIGLLPKRVLQPLSFEELLAAATGVR